jgi:hypothetical protein
MQYNQLLAYRSAYEIQTLHWLGFTLSSIQKPYLIFVLRTIGFTYIAAAALVLIERYSLEKLLESHGFQAEMPGIWPAIGLGFIAALLMVLLGFWATKKQIETIAR